MTRMNPLRRLVATAALIGVTAFGVVAVAGPAMAAPVAHAAAPAKPVPPAGVVVLPATDTMTVGDIMSSLRAADGMTLQPPLPIGPVKFDIAHVKLTFAPEAAQQVQTIVATFYDDLGYQVVFNDKGVLVIGKKICDPAKSKDWNKGCVNPDGPRF
jgi:hypothetical protein